MTDFRKNFFCRQGPSDSRRRGQSEIIFSLSDLTPPPLNTERSERVSGVSERAWPGPCDRGLTLLEQWQPHNLLLSVACLLCGSRACPLDGRVFPCPPPRTRAAVGVSNWGGLSRLGRVSRREKGGKFLRWCTCADLTPPPPSLHPPPHLWCQCGGAAWSRRAVHAPRLPSCPPPWALPPSRRCLPGPA